jgi:hypothetical protein
MPETSPGPFTIHGTVTAQANGLPLAGVLIRVIRGNATNLHKSDTTDSLGRWQIGGVVLESHQLLIEASLQGWVPSDHAQHITHDAQIDFELTR